jgi:uncharacterized membrane protein
MRVVHIAGQAEPEVKIRKLTLSDRALMLADRLNVNHRRQAAKNFKVNKK